jgi:hypothetical protein
MPVNIPFQVRKPVPSFDQGNKQPNKPKAQNRIAHPVVPIGHLVARREKGFLARTRLGVLR